MCRKKYQKFHRMQRRSCIYFIC